MSGILIIQPTIPHYRKAFFDELQRASNVRITVAYSPRSFNKLDNCKLEDIQYNTIVYKRYRVGPLMFSPFYLLAALRKERTIVVNDNVRDLTLFPLIILGFLLRKNIVLWGHGYGTSSHAAFGAQLRKFALSFSQRYITYSARGAASLSENNFPSCKVFTIQNTIDVEFLRVPKAQLASHLSNKVSSNTLIYISRLEPEKDPLAIIDIFEDVKAELPFASLKIIGSGSLRSDLLKRINSSPYSSSILYGRDYSPSTSTISHSL